MNNNISKVLIANRGEISLRVQRACAKLGLASVAVASEADRNALFARSAKECVIIGPAAAKDSYLSIEKILSAAKSTGADAIHPGYGFLSENAAFARAVEQAGLIFIGPSPESIEILGSKTSARKKVQEYGVPCTPGAPGGLDDAELMLIASQIGFPVIIKAVAGGGGRGMRVVETTEQMREVLPRARAEALKNFASADVYCERYIDRPRHVEVQIFGDSYGSVIHLGTRDCSTQRRHQKLVEEAPAPDLSPELRAGLHQAAILAARSVKYRNAGTAEFLVHGEEFFFLEMNTRIQVEHPVTEAVTGLDLVELQLRVARGEPLPCTQEEVPCRGHAIEFRIYAEDPSANFTPSKGVIRSLARPSASWLREDYAYEAGEEVSLHYDAMTSKVIVHASTRGEAIARAHAVFESYRCEGFATTIDFHRWLLARSPFVHGPLDIGYLEREFLAQALTTLQLQGEAGAEWQAPIDSAEHVEVLRYSPPGSVQTLLIHLIHCVGGEFVAVPYSESGVPLERSLWRRSTERASALRGVREILGGRAWD